jgi:hypothetical protein
MSQTPNQIAQILGVMIFEKTRINQAFSEIQARTPEPENHKQLSLFEL